MDYQYFKFSENEIICKNNLFSSSQYQIKIERELEVLNKNNLLTRIKNIWNEYSKDILKSGYLEQLNRTVELLLQDRKNEITMIDLGGGYGDNFYNFRRFNETKLKNIKYFVVDKERKLLKIGQDRFQNLKSVFFQSSFPKKPITILLLVGTLQYIKNFEKIITKINFEKRSYIYLSRTLFTNFKKNFFSIQRIRGGGNIEQLVIINSLESFIKSMSRYGFKEKFIKKNQLISNHFKDLPANQKINYFDLLLEKL